MGFLYGQPMRLDQRGKALCRLTSTPPEEPPSPKRPSGGKRQKGEMDMGNPNRICRPKADAAEELGQLKGSSLVKAESV